MLGRVGDIAPVSGEEIAQIDALKLFEDLVFRLAEGVGLRHGTLRQDGKVNVLPLEYRGRCQDDGSMDNGFQFADVAWPGIYCQLVQGVGGELQRLTTIVVRIAAQKVRGKDGDI